MSDLNLLHTTVCTNCSVEPKDDLIDLVHSARNVSVPDFLTNEDIYISDDDIDDYELTYSTGELEKPDHAHERTVIRSNIIEDDKFHLHSSTEGDHLVDVIETHQKMMASAGEVSIGYISMAYHVDSHIDEIIESIDFIEADNDIAQIDAINFIKDDFDTTISTHPIETLIAVVCPNFEPIQASQIEDVVYDTIDESEDYLTEVIS